MVSLPWDTILDILVRLPLKSIARFRCVNHSWNNELKEGTKFLTAQRRFASEMGKFNLVLHSGNDIDTFHYDPSLNTCERYSRIVYPVESLRRRRGIEVFGCCNGLVLLRHVGKLNKCVLMLWNPTTNECKRIPNPLARTKVWNREYEEYALGYSAQIEDFKVVHLTEGLREGWCEVHVYTLKSNSWRRLDKLEIESIHSYVMNDAVRRPVGGAAHWLGQNAESRFILRFEFETEEFDTTPLPNINRIRDLSLTLCALGGSICLCIGDLGNINTTMWELKQHGDEKSWTKLFAIDLIEQFGTVHYFTPLKSCSDGRILIGLNFGSYLHIVLYDPKHGTVETLQVHESAISAYNIFIYEESLHSFDTGTHLAQLQLEDIVDDEVVGVEAE